jgi:hypothetical protein
MVVQAKWNAAFSRQLQAISVHWTDPTTYVDHTCWNLSTSFSHCAMILICKVKNTRGDIAAHDAAMRLKLIVQPNGIRCDCADISTLKVTGQLLSYSQIIWPESSGEFDLLAVDVERPSRVFLNSKRDLNPRAPIDSNGSYRLIYELVAVGFPRIEVPVSLTVTGYLNLEAQLAP